MHQPMTLVEKAHDAHRGLFLLGSSAQAVESPYFQRSSLQEIGTKQGYKFISVTMNDALIVEILIVAGNPEIAISFSDSSSHIFQSTQVLPMTWTDIATNGLQATINAAIATYAATNSFTIGLIEGQIPTLPSAPSSYQTIVSQTGTAAPAVSGSLVPASTYPSGTTFTWARTSAGVYTLTASTAVFNTSGKTGVFVGSLNNLNAQYTAVVTSSTVITITTAVQSLAVLGLLSFTATPTDALMTKTMVYVQTYS